MTQIAQTANVSTESIVADIIVARRPYLGQMTIDYEKPIDREHLKQELELRGRYTYFANEMTYNPVKDKCVSVTVRRPYRKGGGAFAFLMFKDLSDYMAYIICLGVD